MSPCDLPQPEKRFSTIVPFRSVPAATKKGNRRACACGTLPAMPAARTAVQPASAPVLFRNARAFETWLKKHHATSDGLWLKIAKRGAEEPSVTYDEAVEIALCWGWIDSQKK